MFRFIDQDKANGQIAFISGIDLIESRYNCGDGSRNSATTVGLCKFARCRHGDTVETECVAYGIGCWELGHLVAEGFEFGRFFQDALVEGKLGEVVVIKDDVMLSVADLVGLDEVGVFGGEDDGVEAGR